MKKRHDGDEWDECGDGWLAFLHPITPSPHHPIFFFLFICAICAICGYPSSAGERPRTVKNVYFTSWQYVRYNYFSYVGKDGKPLGAGSDNDAGAAFSFRSPRGIRLSARRPEHLKLDDPLGADPAGLPVAFNVIQHEGKYKCWYAVHPPASEAAPPGHGHNHRICYAESADGFTWTKPSLGLIDAAGSKDNNVVFTPAMGGPERGIHGQCVFLDDSGSPGRFKMVYLGHFTKDEVAAYRAKYPEDVDPMALKPDGSAWGIAGAGSPDGIHWNALPEPMVLQHSDTFHSACYDARRGRYVCYNRIWPSDPALPESGGAGKRSVGRSISGAIRADFRHFSLAEVLLTPGADDLPSHLWYGPCDTHLPGCPDQQVMFPFRWDLEADVMTMPLLSTPDGWVWSQVPGGPVLTSGQPGEWDGGYVLPCTNLIELPGGRWALPYRGFPIRHKYPRIDPAKRELYSGVAAGTGCAIWPKGRLVALECDDEGEFETLGVVPAGTRVFLNASVKPAGWIKVGVRAEYAPIAGRSADDCDPITAADGLEIPVTWKGQAEMNNAGKWVILHFRLRHANLFGIEFR